MNLLHKLEFEGSPVAAIDANGFHELPKARRLGFTFLTADAAIRAHAGVAQLGAAA